MSRSDGAIGRLRRILAIAISGVIVAVLVGLAPQSAMADPVTSTSAPDTVTADALPTWQVNGVVWSQAVVGNTVYVTGSFTKARPPGVALGGPGEIDAQNIFAYDITSGNRVNFTHTLNAQGLVVRGNPEGTRIYVGGDFTEVDGQARAHIAAFDVASGQLVDFNARTDGQVRGFGFAGNTVYVGGNFRSANGQPRNLMAAFSAAPGGQIAAWAPDVQGGYVWSMVMSPDNSRVIASGSFTTINGVSAYGMGSINATTGGTEPWAATNRIRTAGAYGAISSLATDGTQIYGTGYAFGSGASFEGTFAADPYTGNINWVNDCLGDQYDIFPMGQIAYTVSHAHDCTVIGGFPDTNPRARWQKANAFLTYPTGTTTTKDAYGWDFTGLPYSGLAHWYPDLEFGNITASRQAAWTVTGNADYVVLGGEFPSVNGMAQQGLVRFARRPIAPRAMKPIANTPFNPTPYSTESGTVRVVFGSVWDRDNTDVRYEVFRSPWTKIATINRNDSEFWKLPSLSTTDSGAAAGSSVRYQVRATDSDGNIQYSAWSPYITVSDAKPSPFAQAIEADGPSHYWRLNEPTGPVLDSVGDLHGTLSGGSLGASGAITGDTAVTLGASNNITTRDVSSSDSNVSVEAWVKTTSTRGGRIVGFGAAATGNSASGSTDRVLYLDNSGRANFAINNGSYRTITGRTAINDGQWHHLVGVAAAGGTSLYVDGIRVGQDQAATNAKLYNGYWRIGADQTSGFANRPTDAGLNGTIDEVATYARALSQVEIRGHYTASGRAANWMTDAPADGYGAKVVQDSPELYWRLDETAGAVVDASPNGQNGTALGSSSRGKIGALATGWGYELTSGSVVANQSTVSPSVYSGEVWFKTTSNRGGRIFGFGNSTTTSLSSSYDRHVFMRNNGQLVFGSDNGVQNILATTAAYNDGAWHHVVATQGPDGMRLWVDTQLVGSSSVSTVNNYTGAWRLGGDRVWGGATSNYLNGIYDEFAIYPTVLSEAAVREHYTLSGRGAVNRPPVASFVATSDKLKLSVDGSASDDPDGPIASYAWDFGDGTTGTGATASHTYATPGQYTVKLTVTDALGLTAVKSATVDAVSNQLPTAQFTVDESHMKVTLDAASSVDPDGDIESYAWDFGDGEHGTGERMEHTYETPGDYTVTLTVTDDDGATATMSHEVTAELPPNQLPTAKVAAEVDELAVSVDSAGSEDADGTIESYAWDFGDGTVKTGATATHAYAQAGSYVITLTVTDNRGGEGSATKSVTVAPHAAPQAAFTSTVNDLSVALDAGNSADTDGTIESFAWDFGDGDTGTGRTVSHTYDEPGTYQVKLTVTDNDGLTGEVTKEITASAPAVFAEDEFSRTVNPGWGAADRGGNWTMAFGASRFSVADGVGKVLLNASNGYTTYLPTVPGTDTEFRFEASIDKIATGGGQFIAAVGRQVEGTGDYRAQVRVQANGSVILALIRTVGTTETVLTSSTISGLTYAPGETLLVKVQTNGTGTTTLRAKVWKKGSSEPANWTATATDSTSSLQTSGRIGIYSYLSGSTTNGPVVMAYDKIWAGPSR